jgi:hypothetical protein
VVGLEGNVTSGRDRISQPDPNHRVHIDLHFEKMGKAPRGPNTRKKARMEQMGTSDEEYKTFWRPKHEQRLKAGNALMWSKVMGSASTETTDVRPYIQL